MKIWAEQSIIFIDQKDGQTFGNTYIHYEREPNDDIKQPLGVWYWKAGNKSKPIFRSWDPKIGVARVANVDNKITLIEPIQSGEVFTYAIGYITSSGDMSEINKSIQIIGLLKNGQSDFGISQWDPILPFSDYGGTYVRHRFNTRETVSIVYCEYANRTWSIDFENQYLYFKGSEEGYNKLLISQPMHTKHEIFLNTLIPGNIYYFIALIMDEKGRWQFYNDIGISKQREVVFKDLSIEIIKGPNFIEDSLETTWFYHNFTVYDSMNATFPSLTAIHPETKFTKGYKFIRDSTRLGLLSFPLFNQVGFKIPRRAYSNEEYLKVRTWSIGWNADSILNPSQSCNLYFPVGYQESSEQSISLTAIQDDFEYRLLVRYIAIYS